MFLTIVPFCPHILSMEVVLTNPDLLPSWRKHTADFFSCLLQHRVTPTLLAFWEGGSWSSTRFSLVMQKPTVHNLYTDHSCHEILELQTLVSSNLYRLSNICLRIYVSLASTGEAVGPLTCSLFCNFHTFQQLIWKTDIRQFLRQEEYKQPGTEYRAVMISPLNWCLKSADFWMFFPSYSDRSNVQSIQTKYRNAFGRLHFSPCLMLESDQLQSY